MYIIIHLPKFSPDYALYARDRHTAKRSRPLSFPVPRCAPADGHQHVRI